MQTCTGGRPREDTERGRRPHARGRPQEDRPRPLLGLGPTAAGPVSVVSGSGLCCSFGHRGEGTRAGGVYTTFSCPRAVTPPCAGKWKLSWVHSRGETVDRGSVTTGAPSTPTVVWAERGLS